MVRPWLIAVIACVVPAGTLLAAGPDDTLARTQALMARGDYRGALAVLEPLARETGLTPIQHARVYQQLSAARSQVGQDEQALADADVAERDASALAAFDLLARIESVRGVVWLTRGRSMESLRHFQSCAAWAERSKQPALIAGAYTRVAAAYQDLGDWTRALDAVNRAHEAAPQADTQTEVQYLTRKGLIEIELHDGANAIGSIEEALRLARASGDRRSESQVLIDLALVHQRVDRDVTRAASYASDAVGVARTLKLPGLEISALNELGSLLRESGRFADARDRLREALAAITRSGEHRDEPYVLKNLGQTLLALGQAAEGEQRLRDAIGLADADRLTRVRWLARLELARLHAGKDPVEADREFADVLTIVEAQQANVLLEGFRAGALDQTLSEHDPYDLYVQFLLDRGQGERAFEIAERQRARAFLDTLSAARDAIASDVPPGYADAENALLKRISAGRAREADEEALTALRLRLATTSPALAHARYPRPLRLRDVQAGLAPDEATLAYFLGAERSVAWIITPGRVESVVLPGRAEIEARAQAALRELRDPHAAGAGSLDALSRALSIDRLARLPDGTHLVVVPHGILFDVPFEPLRGSDGRRLVERFPVSYAPSASSFAFLRSLPPVPQARETLLAVGDPAAAGVALPQSAREIRRVARLFRPRAQTLEARHATEDALRASVAGGVRILHIATHGVIDETRPDRSALVLTPSSSDDGLLQMREIYRLRVPADLVTLSACQTALGRNVTGEGMIGLTRAFFYAGARSVVASLWDVEDASTADLMEMFYANLRNGASVDVALQRAKLAFLRQGGERSRPFYWAAFVASGSTRGSIPMPHLTLWERIELYALWWAAALLMVVMAAVAVARRRSRGAAPVSAAGV